MMNTSSPIIHPFPGQSAEQWITAYRDEVLASRDAATIAAYTRILHRFADWLAQRPGNHEQFHPQAITRTSVEFFLATLPSPSYKKQAKAALSGFCTWLLEEKQLLDRNPTRGVNVPAQALLAPRELSEGQRYVIRDLVEREADLRGKVVFALRYWAGCRVSDVSWLLLNQVHTTGKAGSMTVGHKGGKERTIDLMNEARRPLHEYLEKGERKASAYVFTSQREKKRLGADELDGWRWSEDGIHQWTQRGIGTALVQSAIVLARRRGACELRGTITHEDAKNSPFLAAWYTKLGFTIQPARREDAGADFWMDLSAPRR